MRLVMIMGIEVTVRYMAIPEPLFSGGMDSAIKAFMAGIPSIPAEERMKPGAV
jgi:hypothetical protein